MAEQMTPSPILKFYKGLINSLQTWPMFYICNTLLPILGGRSTSVRQLLCRIWFHRIQNIRISWGILVTFSFAHVFGKWSFTFRHGWACLVCWWCTWCKLTIWLKKKLQIHPNKNQAHSPPSLPFIQKWYRKTAIQQVEKT